MNLQPINEREAKRNTARFAQRMADALDREMASAPRRERDRMSIGAAALRCRSKRIYRELASSK